MKFKIFTATAIVMALCSSNAADAKRKKQNSSSSSSASTNPELDAMVAKQQAEARAKYPWHFKTPVQMTFGKASSNAILSTEKHARKAFGWVSISQKLQDKSGMFEDYSAYLGITPSGELEGVVYAAGMMASLNDDVGTRTMSRLSVMGIGATGIDETADMLLGPVEKAKSPNGDSNIWFRRFKPSGKAYRMLGALPDEAGISLLYGSPDGPGKLSYWTVRNKEFPHIFQIGYFKEMSKMVRASKKP